MQYISYQVPKSASHHCNCLIPLTKDFSILGVFCHKVQHILGLHDLREDEKKNALQEKSSDTTIDGQHRFQNMH